MNDATLSHTTTSAFIAAAASIQTNFCTKGAEGTLELVTFTGIGGVMTPDNLIAHHAAPGELDEDGFDTISGDCPHTGGKCFATFLNQRVLRKVWADILQDSLWEVLDREWESQFAEDKAFTEYAACAEEEALRLDAHIYAGVYAENP